MRDILPKTRHVSIVALRANLDKKIQNSCRPTVAFHQWLNMQLLQIEQMYVCLWIPLDTYRRLYPTLNQLMEMFKLNIRGFRSKFRYYPYHNGKQI